MRPQPGHAETCGRNERSPRDWSTCWATSTSSSRPGAGLRRERDADGVPDPLVEQDREAGGRRDDPLHRHARLGQAEVERVVGARREDPVRVDEVAHARHLRREDDPVVAEARLLRQLGRSHRGLDHRLDHHVAGVARLGEAGVGLHQVGQQLLVERAPVDADPDGLPVVDRDPDDRREVLVVALGADVARVDPVLREPGRHLRVLHEQLVAVVVEVADDRHVDAEVVAQLLEHRGDGRRGLLGVHGDPDELRARVGEARDLDRGRVGVGGVGVGHRLDDDRVGRADQDAPDVDRDGGSPHGPELVRRRHGVPLTCFAMSNTVIQIRNVNSATNPTAYVSCSARSEIRVP